MQSSRPDFVYPFLYDWTVNIAPTCSSNKILINNGNYAYLKLAGPNLSNLPVMMTTDISLDGGGSAGLDYIDISPDGNVWTNVLTQASFVSGLAVHYLPGSEFMTDILVRFRNASGTSGVYLRIGAMRFDVTRKIASGGVPLHAVGTTTATLGCNASYSKSVDIAGMFRSIRHMV